MLDYESQVGQGVRLDDILADDAGKEGRALRRPGRQLDSSGIVQFRRSVSTGHLSVMWFSI